MVLYKYVSACSAMRILDEMRLKVALPNECNDPFEFTPRTMMTLTCKYFLEKLRTDPEHYRSIYDDMVREGFSRPFPEFLRALPDQIQRKSPETRRLLRTVFVKNDLTARDEASKFAGALCLCFTNNSIPMWSHYCHNHKGVVIGVRPNDAAFSHGRGDKVKYVKHRVSVDPRVSIGTQSWWTQIYRTMFCKSLEWSYEQEFRIVFRLKDLAAGKLDDGRPAFFIDIWGSTILSIVFGCLTPPEEEAKIRDLIKSKRHLADVRIFRAQGNRNRFALDIVPSTP